MRRIILRIFSTSSGIIVLNQILKDAGEEIVILCKRFFKGEIHEFIHQSTGEGRTLCRIGHKRCQCLEQWNLRIGCGLRREYIRIQLCNVRHGRIEDGIKITFPLLVPQVGYQMVRFKHRNIWRDGTLNKHTFIIRKILVCCFPFYIPGQFLCYFTFRIFQFITEFVIQKFIEKYLSDNLIFVTIVSHTI